MTYILFCGTKLTLVKLVVSLHNTLYQLVPYNIFLVEFYPSDARHMLQHAHRFLQSGSDRGRQIDLCHIARHDHLGIHAETCQKHLDLMGGGVLRLVEHYHGIVEGAAAHEGQGSDLYHLGFHILAQLHSGDHILQSVVERLQIGVDLVLHVAGEEAELLAGLDSRTREDDLARLAVLERTHRQGYRHIGLARAGRTERECQVVVRELLDEFLLIRRAAHDRLAVDAVDDDVVALELARRLTLDDVDDDILVQRIILRGMRLESLDSLLEISGLAILANDLYHRASRRNAQLRIKILYQLHIRIIDPVKADRVDIVEDDDAFNHNSDEY